MPSGSTASRATPPPPATPAPSRGRVQRIYPERGFGFIRCTEGAADDLGQDFFFHHTGLTDTTISQLQEGSVVAFTPTYVPKGKRAEQIITREGV